MHGNVINVIPYLAIPHERVSGASSLQSTLFQFSLSLGMSFGALLLQGLLSVQGLTLAPDAPPEAIRAAFHDRLAAHPHLMVLRTFSKIYGLPNLRVGVFMSANPEYRRGVLAYRPTFPLSWFSLYTCQLALLDDDWLIEARSRLSRRKPLVEAGLDALTGFERLPSQVNTVMFRHRELPAAEVQHRLADHGVLVANLDQVSGIQNQGWLRMTVRSEADNAVFLVACAGISSRD